eukprot:FR744084.1.p1 GENE.FR744084.1~~FR744084.1.p1  ORF type:complete len:191 (+),score=26.06 FR744084.1:195-767(+)
MATGIEDEKLMEALVSKSSCVKVFVRLLGCGHPELVHRAAVGIECLCTVPLGLSTLNKEGGLTALKIVATAKQAKKAAAKDKVNWPPALAAVAAALEAVTSATPARDVVVEVSDNGTFDLSAAEIYLAKHGFCQDHWSILQIPTDPSLDLLLPSPIPTSPTPRAHKGPRSTESFIIRSAPTALDSPFFVF